MFNRASLLKSYQLDSVICVCCQNSKYWFQSIIFIDNQRIMLCDLNNKFWSTVSSNYVHDKIKIS